jgi:hypothetical protein
MTQQPAPPLNPPSPLLLSVWVVSWVTVGVAGVVGVVSFLGVQPGAQTKGIIAATLAAICLVGGLVTVLTTLVTRFRRGSAHLPGSFYRKAYGSAGLALAFAAYLGYLAASQL